MKEKGLLSLSAGQLEDVRSGRPHTQPTFSLETEGSLGYGAAG